MSYSYVITREDTGAAVEVTLKGNFLPPIFYDYLKKGREESFTPEEYEDNEKLKKELCYKALGMKKEELFEVKRLK